MQTSRPSHGVPRQNPLWTLSSTVHALGRSLFGAGAVAISHAEPCHHHSSSIIMSLIIIQVSIVMIPIANHDHHWTDQSVASGLAPVNSLI